MPRASFSLALVAVAFTAISTGVRAQAQEPISIRVDGSVFCTSEPDFFARVQGRAPGARNGQPGEPTRSFTISLDGVAPTMHGRLSIVHLDGRSSTREVTGESCRDVVDALALITAVDIDPDAARATPGERMAVTFPSTSNEREPPTPPLVAPVPALPWHFSAGLEPSVTTGVAPQPLYGLPVFLELTSPSSALLSPSFAVGFERTFNSTTVLPAGDAVFDLVEGFLQACPLAYNSTRLRAGPCLRFDAGLLQAAGKQGKGLTAAQDSGPWLALGLVGRATYRLGGPVFLGAQFGLGIPVVPYEYKFDNPSTKLGESGGLHLRAGIGLAVRFL